MWWRSALLITLLFGMLLFGGTIKEKARTAVLDPNVALLVISLGICLVCCEFLLPGTVALAVVGGTAIALGAFGLAQMEIQALSLLSIVIGAVLVVIEARFPLYGLAAISGTLLMCVGAGTLCFGMRPAWAAAILIPLAAATFLLFRFAFIARRNKEVAFLWAR